MEKALKIKGAPEDIDKLKAIFRVLFPDIKIIPKQIQAESPSKLKRNAERDKISSPAFPFFS